MPKCDEIGRFGAALRKARRNSQAIHEMNALTPELQKMKLPDDKRFGQAVAVYGHRAGDVFNVGSAREALDWLLYEWPDGGLDSLKMRAARRACAAALDGGDAEIARLAFRLAVAEAGNLIGDVDRVRKGADPSRLSLSKRPPPPPCQAPVRHAQLGDDHDGRVQLSMRAVKGRAQPPPSE